jgi:hypothetical protein
VVGTIVTIAGQNHNTNSATDQHVKVFILETRERINTRSNIVHLLTGKRVKEVLVTMILSGLLGGAIFAGLLEARATAGFAQNGHHPSSWAAERTDSGPS